MEMKKLAVGIAAAAVLLTAAPAMAQVGFYAGPGGVGVQFGGPYYGSGYGVYPYRHRYYDYYNGPTWPGPRVWHGHRFHHHWRH
jgi:hypothetical protein